MAEYWQIKADRNLSAIKRFYLNRGKTEQQWQVVMQNPQAFNRVWRRMLGLPVGDMPPPIAYR